MRTVFNSKDNKAVSNYSENLIRGVILNSKLAKLATDSRDVITFNSSCVIFCVAYMEASLNEITSTISDSGSKVTTIHPRYWELLKEKQKNFRIQDKWDYIALAYGGEIWDSSKEPFQSFEIINSLRNELIHFKGEKIELGEAPIKKLANLLKEFSGEDLDYKSEAVKEIFGNGKLDWTFQLLSSRDFGRWLAKKILFFDLNQSVLLRGTELSDSEKTHYWVKWEQLLFAVKTPNDFSDVEEALSFLETIILPETNTKKTCLNLPTLNSFTSSTAYKKITRARRRILWF